MPYQLQTFNIIFMFIYGCSFTNHLTTCFNGSYIFFPGQKEKKTIIAGPFPDSYRDILMKQVPFYQQLNAQNCWKRNMLLFMNCLKKYFVSSRVS